MSKIAYDISLNDTYKNCTSKQIFVLQGKTKDMEYLTFYNINVDYPLCRMFFYNNSTHIYNYITKKYSSAYLKNLRCLYGIEEIDTSWIDLDSWLIKLKQEKSESLDFVSIISNYQWQRRKESYQKKMTPLYAAFLTFTIPKNLHNFLEEKVFYDRNYSIYSKANHSAYCTGCKRDYIPEKKLTHDDKDICPLCQSTNEVKLERHYKHTKKLSSVGCFIKIENTQVDIVVRYFRVYRNCSNYSYSYDIQELSRTVLNEGGIRLGFRHNEYLGFNWHKTGYRTSVYYNGYYTYEPTCIYPSFTLVGSTYSQSGFDLYCKSQTWCDPIAYFHWYKSFNGLEQLSKYGLHDLIHSTIFNYTTYENLHLTKDSVYYDVFNEKETNLTNILGLSKGELRELKINKIRMLELWAYKYFNKNEHNITLGETKLLFVNCTYAREFKAIVLEIEKALKYISISKLLHFVKRHNVSNIRDFLITYTDYVDMFLQLGIKPYKYNLLPKDLYKSHAYIQGQLKIKENPETEIKIQNRYNKYKDLYNKYIEGYHFLIPSSICDLLEESNKLKHCVKQYINSHADETTLIIFIRKNIDTSLYTLEVKNGECRQLEGYEHSKPPKEMHLIVDEYLQLINHQLQIAI